MKRLRLLTLLILPAILLVSCGGDDSESGASGSPTATASPSPAPDDSAAVPADHEPVDGLVEVSFGDVTVTATPTRCGFDANVEVPGDASPVATLHVLATGPGPAGEMWEVQVSRVLGDGAIIDTVNVHSNAGVAVDRYEAQRVVDTHARQVDDLWGDSTNSLLMPVVNGDELTVRPPDDVTFGVYPAEHEEPATIAGTGTFSVACSPVS